MNKLKLFAFAIAVLALTFTSCKKDDNNESGNKPSDDHAYVDLGLPSGLLWATCNIGADKPEDYGDYFAWGETATKDSYSWYTYKWCNGSYNNLTKYNSDPDYGTVDDKTMLEPADDAAHVNWGGDWRMPTLDEMEELEDNCTWEWTAQGGKDGYCVTGSNGNSIFLPAAGCYYGDSISYAGSDGYYWSSLHGDGYPFGSYDLGFDSVYLGKNNYDRYYGHSVRPVCNSQN